MKQGIEVTNKSLGVKCSLILHQDKKIFAGYFHASPLLKEKQSRFSWELLNTFAMNLYADYWVNDFSWNTKQAYVNKAVNWLV